MKIGFKIFGIFIAILAFGFLMQGLDLINLKFWAPKYQNVKRDVFENTNSFTKAKRQEVAKYMLEYKSTDDVEEKNAIKYMLSQSLADFNEDKYVKSKEMLRFIKQMKYEAPLPIPTKIVPLE